MAGNVRRYASFVDDYLQPLIPVHRFITVAALITGAAQVIFVYNLIHSRFWGKPAPDNPWEATSLEWSTATPPPFDNFGGKFPVVYHDPYQYGVKSSVGDYVMQASPEQVKTERRREVTMPNTIQEPPQVDLNKSADQGPAGNGGWKDSCSRRGRGQGRAVLFAAGVCDRHLGGAFCHHDDVCSVYQRSDRS